MNEIAKPAPRTVIPAEQIQKRVREMARQISDDYQRTDRSTRWPCWKTALCFMADLVRALDVPVICQFIKPKYSCARKTAPSGVLEIFFSHEPDIRGQHVLLVEGLVHSGVTSEFLMNDLRARGAASVKLATLLDRPVGAPGPVAARLFWVSGG